MEGKGPLAYSGSLFGVIIFPIAISWSSGCFAQSALDPGLISEYFEDEYGVDLRTGAYQFDMTLAEIGSGSFSSKLSLELLYSSSGTSISPGHNFYSYFRYCSNIICIQNGESVIASASLGKRNVQWGPELYSIGASAKYEFDIYSGAYIYWSDGSKLTFAQDMACGQYLKCYKATLWEWPNGEKIRFKYTSTGVLQQVSNSYGHVIKFVENSGYISSADLFSVSNGSTCLGANSIICVLPPETRHVSFSWTSFAGANVLSSITRPDLSQINFTYMTSPQGKVVLKSHAEGGLPPAWQNTYTGYAAHPGYPNSLSHAVTSQIFFDNSARSFTYSTNPFTAAKNGTLLRVDKIDRAGNVSWHESATEEISVSDQLQRVTVAKFAGGRNPRIRAVEMPNGGEVSYEFDSRGNITSATRTPSSPAEQLLVEEFFYQEGPEVVNCINFKTCNRLAYTLDNGGNRTDYTWDANGNMLSVTGPADPSGNRPLTSYTYAAHNAADGSVVYLRDTMTVKIDSSSSIITKYVYDDGLKLGEVIEDFGGQNRRECFRYNQWGQVISRTQPLGATSVCPI